MNFNIKYQPAGQNIGYFDQIFRLFICVLIVGH